jgi:hypothetical protein
MTSDSCDVYRAPAVTTMYKVLAEPYSMAEHIRLYYIWSKALLSNTIAELKLVSPY